MNLSTSKIIDELLNDSNLLSKKAKPHKNSENYNFSEEVILVTGAAGSIGSGLSKQLIHCTYKKLILLDIAESPLYELIKELETTNNVEFILLNITKKKSIEYLFKKFKPTLIFHAAAYKHVPLMEHNPYEAVKLNFFSTKLLADFSILNNVKKFIFISTDKAVNPIGVMGLTKRVAENYLTLLNKTNTTHFLNTRFGNIFGSSGSVIPLFIKQIEAGMPITITSEKIARYFICKHKACNLILKTSTLNRLNNNLFTFDMGEPIKVIDLATKLIDYLANNKDAIEIKITGLRPGEKFEEELVSKDEELLNTDYKGILLIISKKAMEFKKNDFDILLNITLYNSKTEIKSLLKKLI